MTIKPFLPFLLEKLVAWRKEKPLYFLCHTGIMLTVSNYYMCCATPLKWHTGSDFCLLFFFKFPSGQVVKWFPSITRIAIMCHNFLSSISKITLHRDKWTSYTSVLLINKSNKVTWFVKRHRKCMHSNKTNVYAKQQGSEIWPNIHIAIYIAASSDNNIYCNIYILIEPFQNRLHRPLGHCLFFRKPKKDDTCLTKHQINIIISRKRNWTFTF